MTNMVGSLLVLALLVIGCWSQQQAARGDTAKGNPMDETTRGDREVEFNKGMFVPFPRLNWKTIAQSTEDLFRSFLSHDLSRAMLYWNDRSLLIYHSIVPAAGVYKGSHGLFQFLERSSRTAHLTDASYRILFVDEARGVSVIEWRCSGSFYRNNNTFSDLQSYVFIKWSLGKIAAINLVDRDTSKLLKAFETKAEQFKSKLVESMFVNGANEKTLSLVSDDVVLSFPGLYPSTLLSQLGLQMASNQSVAGIGSSVHKDTLTSTGSGGAAGSGAAHVEENVVTLKGKQQFASYVDLAQKVWFPRVIKGKYLYGDDTTAVWMFVLEDPNCIPTLSDPYCMKTRTILVTISRFNPQGLLASREVFLNRPIMPWQLDHFRSQLSAIKSTTH